MKQLDRLLLKSFVGPFVVAFVIALFAFLMQYLWVYIDEIIGKGAGIVLIAELVTYLSVSLMPMALPVAVLIASVMTMGNFAEHYELASMKSAGVPLLRVMAPLMLAGLLITAFSFACSNYLIPVANLKARTRLYDIRKQKPALSLEEGAFNDDFQGFSIRIGHKAEDDKSLEDVMLFRQGGALRGRIEAVSAARGMMDVTPDDRYFVLELEDGYQYQEPESTGENGRRTHPFVRTQFATYRKNFDLSEFEIDVTDENAFEDHQAMLNVWQLGEAIDSIQGALASRRDRLALEVGRFISPLKQLDRIKQDSLDRIARDSISLAQDLAIANSEDVSAVMDSLRVAAAKSDSALAKSVAAPGDELLRRGPSRPDRRLNASAGGDRNVVVAQSVPAIVLDSSQLSYVAYLNSRPEYKRSAYADRLTQAARTISSYAEGAQRRIKAQQESLVSHVYEQHTKFSFALACFVFLFIGAPMGAIIRKGGFGYPMLVSIVFFTVFIIFTIMSKKLAQSFAIGPVFAAWLPTLVIFPIGVALTYIAMNDIKFSIGEQLGNSKAWQWVQARIGKKAKAA